MNNNGIIENNPRTKKNFSRKLLGLSALAILSAVFVSTVLVVHVLRARAPSQPPTVVVLLCQPVSSGIHRIISDFGTQFDVPEPMFKVHKTMRDMPGGALYAVTLKDGANTMMIWRDDDIFRELKEAFPVFSERVEHRDLRNPKGDVVGRDRWGYLKDGERWRYVTFSSGDAVGYRPSASREARLFDQIISSACISPDPQPRPIK